MKNIVLSAVAVLAMSSFAVAGGDIAPVEEPVIVAEPVITDSGFYLGLAYSYMNAESTTSVAGYLPNGDYVLAERTLVDDSINSGMLQAGYKFNSYVAVEGRYYFGGSTDSVAIDGYPNVTGEIDLDSWGIYVKPMYPVTDAFDIYALLGYANNSFDTELTNTVTNTKVTISDDNDYDGFSWGIGAAYSFTENVSVFVDYVVLYDDNTNYGDLYNFTTDDSLDSWNFGVSYKF